MVSGGIYEVFFNGRVGFGFALLVAQFKGVDGRYGVGVTATGTYGVVVAQSAAFDMEFYVQLRNETGYNSFDAS